MFVGITCYMYMVHVWNMYTGTGIVPVQLDPVSLYGEL